MDDASDAKVISLRYAGICVICDASLPARTRAWWDKTISAVSCVGCGPPHLTQESFVAGRAAWRKEQRYREQYEAEAAKYAQLGAVRRFFTAAPAPSADERAWRKGREGEQWVAQWLNPLREHGYMVLHDLRMPNSSANIDHVVVAPTGVYIIDAKHYSGWITIEEKREGTVLVVNGRKRTNLLQGVGRQVLPVDAAIRDLALPTLVTPVLCFVNGDWLKSTGWKIDGVHIVPPERLREMLLEPGPLSRSVAAMVGARLMRTFRRA